MTDIDNLREEVGFLQDEIRGLKMRMAGKGNAVQRYRLTMLERLLSRCERGLANRGAVV